MQKILLLVITAFLMFGCVPKDQKKEIKIATNKWIGYAPLFLANENKELEKLHFRLIQNVSLAEAMEVFSIGKADIVTTTQHEYFALKRTGDISPIILLDRSDGGDMILSNRTIPQLKEAEKIDVYLEIDSINTELFKTFAKIYNIDQNRTVFHNQDQQRIQNVENDPQKPIIIVTYSPYDITLKKKGFRSIASTKDIDTIVVIDALCARDDIIWSYQPRLEALKKAIDSAVTTIQTNPHAAYGKIKKYLGNISYDEFEKSLSMIKWINKPSDKIMQVIEKMGYPKDTVLP